VSVDDVAGAVAGVTAALSEPAASDLANPTGVSALVAGAGIAPVITGELSAGGTGTAAGSVFVDVAFGVVVTRGSNAAVVRAARSAAFLDVSLHAESVSAQPNVTTRVAMIR